jgi:diguanylate cyclase (GGDEF)-like protein
MPSEQQLSGVLSEFARTMLTDFPIQAILDTLVKRILEIMPIVGAGVTLISPGASPRYIAASDPLALRFEELQSELAEGPCVAAYRTGEAVAVPDLRVDDRFPRFRARALEEGLAGVFTYPLRHRDERLGALDLYRDITGPMDGATMAAAQTLADVASAYLINAEARADLTDAFEQSRERALHDALTGLPNRILLLDRLEHALARRHRHPAGTAVLFIDIDRFKSINDSLGHDAGDRLLTEVAHRLLTAARPGDTVARFEGDEFVVLCEDVGTEDDVASLARRLAGVVRAPFTIDDHEITPTVSTGIALAAADGDETAAALVRDADTAMYRAKEEGRDRHEIFDADMRVRAQRHLQTESALRRALSRDELVVLYQPVMDLACQGVIGVEALVRWDLPEGGRLRPESFIPLAEETGLIVPIGELVLDAACHQLAAWNGDVDLQLDLTVAVNLSARQLIAPGLTDAVRRAVTSAGIAPHTLCLEITESSLLDDPDAATDAVRQLRIMGVRVGVDDFGTGFSSLSYLKRFPLDVLKIDKPFIDDLAVDRHDRVVIAALVDLAHALGLRVTAEGVETEQQAALLEALGCDAAQGSLWSGPLDADDLTRWLRQARRTPNERRPNPSNAAAKVLLVDAPGYTVIGAADDGREAVALAARTQPDLVLLDLTVPGVSGLPALRRILEVAPHTKVVVLTTTDSAEAEAAAHASGAAGCLDRTVDLAGLPDRLDAILEPAPP